MYADAGDVYCVYNIRLKQYTACQVTRVEEHGGKKTYATLLALDWQGNKPLGAAELADLKPLYKDFMYWERGLHMYKASAVVPTGYVRVGNIAPLVGEDTQRYASFWGDGYDVYRQLRWQQIPEKQRKAFKKAAKSKKTVMFAGREYGISKQNLSDVWDDFEDAMELKAFPCLSSLFLTKWHKNLYEYLEEYPFITRLCLENHGQTVLDFSNTRITDLSVDMTGVESLYLNEGLDSLNLKGEIKENCKVCTAEKGAGLILEVGKSVPKVRGLENLTAVNVMGIADFDMQNLSETYPKLKTIRLWGKPGNIANFSAVSGFEDLEVFTTVDLFGFGADDIPHPDRLPKLHRLWMSSLPEEAAKAVKKLYKKRKEDGLDLWIEKARKPEWLAQNFDNPFRDWDGAEHIPKSQAKKAAELYRKTRAGVVKLLGNPPENIGGGLAEAVKAYTGGFNKMDKKHFIDTVEREDIAEALETILDLIPEGSCADKEKLFEIFDKNRNF